MTQTPLFITSKQKNYPVLFFQEEQDILAELATIKNSVIILDANIYQLYPTFAKALAALSPVFILDSSEENKTLSTAEKLFTFFQTTQTTLATTVIAIGGGVLQDVTSFAAHVFYRGLKVILIPTTLLAMCDSCIGGKCGVNFNGYKNQLGAFHPPEKVWIYPAFLDSLPKADLHSGYGELLKYMLLKDQESFKQWSCKLQHTGITHENLVEDIVTGLIIKKSYIEQDEFDTGIRHLLNFGHTFGHAIERATNYVIPHGIAVAQGIDIANYIALQRGVLKQATFDQVQLVIQDYFSNQFAKNLSANALIENVKKDKKLQAQQLKMVLMEDFGQFRLENVMLDDRLRDEVEEKL